MPEDEINAKALRVAYRYTMSREGMYTRNSYELHNDIMDLIRSDRKKRADQEDLARSGDIQ